MNEFKLKPQQYWLLKDGTWSKSEPPYDQVVQTIRAIPATFYEIVLDERDEVSKMYTDLCHEYAKLEQELLRWKNQSDHFQERDNISRDRYSEAVQRANALSNELNELRIKYGEQPSGWYKV